MRELRTTKDGELSAEVYRRAQGGDREAVEAIVRQHQRAVRAWVAAHCPIGCDADEIAQRTFLAAILRLPEFEIGTNFTAWLLTIARYQMMTEATRLRRLADYHMRHAPDLLARELERRVQQSEDIVSNRLRYLRECLTILTDASRQILQWRYEDDVSLEEMSRRSGRSLAAMKKQLWLLRQKLQLCIEGKLAAEQGGAP